MDRQIVITLLNELKSWERKYSEEFLQRLRGSGLAARWQ